MGGTLLHISLENYVMWQRLIPMTRLLRYLLELYIAKCLLSLANFIFGNLIVFLLKAMVECFFS